jgi:hypothetical protein
LTPPSAAELHEWLKSGEVRLSMGEGEDVGYALHKSDGRGRLLMFSTIHASAGEAS